MAITQVGLIRRCVDDGRRTSSHMKCEKCDGAGWLWGYELDDPDEDTYTDSMTQYTCDRCQGTGQEPLGGDV